MPTALITGVSGQDGSYLAEFLVARDYRVIGTTRNAARAVQGPFGAALRGVELLELESPEMWLAKLVEHAKADEVYHLGGPSRVSDSWTDPEGTRLATVLQTSVLVEQIVQELPSPRLFFAGSCEVFAPEERPQDESSPRAPASPYGQAKLEAMDKVRKAREQFGIYAVTGILFNHESPRRGDGFVTRKIARAAARIAQGKEKTLTLGNLEVRRDWGFAGDYVRAMWLMMFQDEPADLVIGTGEAHSVATFCEIAFRHVGLSWRDHVVSDPALFRQADAPLRLANPARAKAQLGWTPEVDFERLVTMMVDYELGVVT
jgi:GDPmannose 4,6-dehydratase